MKNKKNNAGQEKKATKTWLIVMGILLLILVIWLASCKVIVNKTTSYNYYNSVRSGNDSGDILINFPAGPARQRLLEGIKAFQLFYGSTFEIQEIANEGRVNDVNALANEMFSSYFVITGGDEAIFSVNEPLTNPVTLDTAFHLKNMNSMEDTVAILKTLKLNIQTGDFRVNARILDKRTKSIYHSFNSISEEGTRISGIFFLTTVRVDDNITNSIRPNTNCPVKTIATYIFTGLPKITVEVCVRATCKQGYKNKKTQDSISGCQITEVQPNIGPFCDFKIFPDPEKNLSQKGEITKEGCVARFAWAYVTGFKSLKVSNKAAGEFEVEGLIGCSAKGSFQVCDRCNADPEICR